MADQQEVDSIVQAVASSYGLELDRDEVAAVLSGPPPAELKQLVQGFMQGIDPSTLPLEVQRALEKFK